MLGCTGFTRWKASKMQLDLTDRKLLNLAQREFPLVTRPYAELGARLGTSEEECLAR
ncbi:MAG: Lrp/AsnC family transcriptional regulator, partial [Chloroflexi bacterium]|nr:Lrp/AsnC family transcriptional regulator [Chloroflexota bacterium]